MKNLNNNYRVGDFVFVTIKVIKTCDTRFTIHQLTKFKVVKVNNLSVEIKDTYNRNLTFLVSTNDIRRWTNDDEIKNTTYKKT